MERFTVEEKKIIFQIINIIIVIYNAWANEKLQFIFIKINNFFFFCSVLYSVYRALTSTIIYLVILFVATEKKAIFLVVFFLLINNTVVFHLFFLYTARRDAYKGGNKVVFCIESMQQLCGWNGNFLVYTFGLVFYGFFLSKVFLPRSP
jgi:hypothetical protein